MYEYINAFTVTIELAVDVLEQARALAVRIERENVENGRENKQGIDPVKSLGYRISGYQGEAAVALMLGLTPKTDDHWQRRADVGGYDVRTSKRHDAGLIFSPRDPLWSVKILVIDECPYFHIVGCYQCADARDHREWWKEPRPGGGCWIVPQTELREVNSGDDVRPIGEREKKNLDRFSRDWRTQLYEKGVVPPEASPLAKAIISKSAVDKMANEPYGSGASLRNPGGNVYRVDGLDPKLATYHKPEES